MQFKYISCKEIISRVYRDLNLQEETRWVDMIEWIGECVEMIGATVQFEYKHKELKVVDFRALIPCDLIHIKQLTYKQQALVQSTSTVLPHKHELERDNNKDKNYTFNSSFVIQGNFIILGIKEGDINLYYYGMALDEDGFLLIPDTPGYKDAVIHYIIYKLKFSDSIKGIIPIGELDYWTNIKNNKMNKARAQISMPTVSQMEAYGRTFLRLVPEMRAFDNMFVTNDKFKQSS